MADTYSIKRVYFRKHGRKYTIACGLTLEQAQEWCRDHETSSSTCTSSYRRSLTRKHGAWFDAYFKEN